MKIDKKSGKTLIKNGHMFLLRLLNSEKGCASRLEELLNKWPSPDRDEPLEIASEDKTQEIKKKRKQAMSQRIKFIISLQKENKLLKFIYDILDFLEKYNLGKEWFIPITDYIISLWFFPPIYNLDIQKTDKRVLLTLNPDTSLNDIKDAWTEIKRKQKEL